MCNGTPGQRSPHRRRDGAIPGTITLLALAALALGSAPALGSGHGAAETPSAAAGPAPQDTTPKPTRKEPPEETDVVDVSLTDVPPRLLNAREAQITLQTLYPPELRAARITGQTHLRFVIDRDGRVSANSIKVTKTTHPQFAEAAIPVARVMRFSPARIGGRPVPVLVAIPISWTLLAGVP